MRNREYSIVAYVQERQVKTPIHLINIASHSVLTVQPRPHFNAKMKIPFLKFYLLEPNGWNGHFEVAHRLFHPVATCDLRVRGMGLSSCHSPTSNLRIRHTSARATLCGTKRSGIVQCVDCRHPLVAISRPRALGRQGANNLRTSTQAETSVTTSTSFWLRPGFINRIVRLARQLASGTSSGKLR